MSNWVTPAGSIGTYTQQQQFVFDLEATTNLGGVIVFEIQGKWPPGSYNLETIKISASEYRGRITATPAFVNIATTFNFVVSATEITGSGGTPNPRTFQVTVNNTQWTTGTDLGEYTELIPISIQLDAQPSVPGNTVEYALLNGSFPVSSNDSTAFALSTSGSLTGTPGQVNEIVTSYFTVRALEYKMTPTKTLVSFRDRTFSIAISGTTAPVFITPAGSELFVTQDSTWIDYQVLYSNPDPDTGAIISLASGSLPPGLEITPAGFIKGYAEPPVNSAGAPVNATYSFTLSVQSQSGNSLAAYTITVKNQELEPGFAGRQPTILNNRPLTLVPPEDDPESSYYLSGNNLGQYPSDNYFVFRFLGYDFDGDSLTYQVQPADVFSNLGLTFDTSTGWVTGTITGNPTPSVDTYNFIVTVFKTLNPAIRSENFKFGLTVTNNINLEVVWLTDSDLGDIDNGSTSVKIVQAESLAGKTLAYRLSGNDFSTDLRSVIHTADAFQSFGLSGGYVQGTDDGQDWAENTSTFLTSAQFNIYGSIYNPFTGVSIVVGDNPAGQGIFAFSGDGASWLFNFGTNGPGTLRSIVFNGNNVSPLYAVVGHDGYCMTSTNASTWTQRNTGVTDDLNQVYYNGSLYVAVGNQGTVLTSSDAVTWTKVVNSVTVDINSVVYTGSSWILVGDLGTIVRATNINNSATWVTSTLLPNNDYNSITVGASDLVAVGSQGAVITSNDDGLNWTVQNLNTTNTFYDVYYDSVTTNAFWAVGEAGTIYTSSDTSTWSSPTISSLPPNISLQPSGELVGRLAFQSQDTVIPVGTSTTYRFSVQAFCTDPGFEEITSVKQFTLTTVQKFALPYDNLYIRALTSASDRAYVNSIIQSTVLIPPASLYRPNDPNFGRSREIRYQHMFGVPSVASDDFYAEYVQAVTKNHYWRNITLGPIQTAVARNSLNEIIYEVVYSPVLDNLENAQGVSISKQITWPRPISLNLGPYYTSTQSLFDSMTYYDPEPVAKTIAAALTTTVLQFASLDGLSVGMNMTGAGVALRPDNTPPVITALDTASNTVTVNQAQTLVTGMQVVFSRPATTSQTLGSVRTLYPNSLYNMREQIADTIGFINDSSLLPLWMSTQQLDGSTLGYTPAWVICYTNPGQSATVAQNINNYMAAQGKYLNDIDFQIDRFEVDRSMTYSFLGGTASAPIWDDLPSPSVNNNSQDSYVYFPQKTILPTENQE